MYTNSLARDFLIIIDQYRIINLRLNDDNDCIFDDNFRYIFNIIRDFFSRWYQLSPLDYDGYVIELTNFLEPVNFNAFLFPNGYVDKDGYLEQELLDYCNNIMTQVIKCYSEAGNITKIDTTTLDFNNNDRELDGINDFLQKNIADVVSDSFDGNDGNNGNAAAARSGGIMVGGNGFNDKLKKIPNNYSLDEGFSGKKINKLLEIFRDDVQMVYYILDLYIEEGNNPEEYLDKKWQHFYDTYVSLNFFFPEIFENYSGIKEYGVDESAGSAKSAASAESANFKKIYNNYKSLNNILRDKINEKNNNLLDLTLEQLSDSSGISASNLNDMIVYLNEKVDRVKDEFDIQRKMPSSASQGNGSAIVDFRMTPERQTSERVRRIDSGPHTAFLTDFAGKDFSEITSDNQRLSQLELERQLKSSGPQIPLDKIIEESSGVASSSRAAAAYKIDMSDRGSADINSSDDKSAASADARSENNPAGKKSLKKTKIKDMEERPDVINIMAPIMAPPQQTASLVEETHLPLDEELVNTFLNPFPNTKKPRSVSLQEKTLQEKPPRTKKKRSDGFESESEGEGEEDEGFGDEDKEFRDEDRVVGGQKGGGCDPIFINAFIVLFAYKIITEFIHDIGTGDRGRLVKNNTAMYNAVLDVFIRIATYFKDNSAIGRFVTAANQPSHELINTLNSEIAVINEDKYMSAIIRTMIKHCPDMLTEFYYKPMYVYVCKYDDSKTTKSAYDVLYDLFRDKIMEIFPKEEGWMIFANPNDSITNIHLYVFKPPDQSGDSVDVDLGFYTQDMGLEDIPLGAALRMKSFIEIYDAFFQGSNDIQLFFQADGSINADYARQIRDALAPLESGKIENEKISNSMELFTTFKGTDPLSSHQPFYGEIMSNDLKRLYLGYNPGIYNPLVDDFVYPVGGGGEHLDDDTKNKLKKLNLVTYRGTIDSMNKLLSYWIGTDDPTDQPMQIVTDYTFIMDLPVGSPGRKIIGLDFRGPLHGGLEFRFKLFFGGASVGDVCQQMDAFNNDIAYDENSLIGQMKHIYDHPHFRFKRSPGSQNEKNMKLAIIASFKSYGDEGQRLISQYISENFGAIFFLTKDRVLLVETIKFRHPILGFTKSPHEEFDNSNEIEDARENGISCIYTGVISNTKSMIEKIQNTFQLLLAALNDYDINMTKLDAKLVPHVASAAPVTKGGQPPPKCYTDVQTRIDELHALGIINAQQYDVAFEAFKAYKAALAANGNDADAAAAATAAATAAAAALSVPFLEPDIQAIVASTLTVTNDDVNKGLLDALVKYNGIIKQVLLSLKYFDYARGYTQADIKALIDIQVRKAVSIAIPDKSKLSLILSVAGRTNLNIPFKTTTSLVEVLKLLHNEKEFSRNIIDSYQIACDEMIKNMTAFLQIIQDNTYTTEETARGISSQDKILVEQKGEIITHYDRIITSIYSLKYEFLQKYRLNIVEEINKLQTGRAARGNESKDRQQLRLEIQSLVTKISDLEEKKAELNQKMPTLDEEIKELVTAKNTPLKVLKGGLTKFFTKVQELINPDIKKDEINQAIREAKELKSKLSKSFANFLEESKNTLITLCRANGKLIATDHKKDGEILTRTLSYLNKQIVSSDLGSGLGLGLGSGLGLGLGSGSSSSSSGFGGKKKTRQNRQRLQKKYTKQHNKKIYRKRTKKHFKIKRHKYTKKR